MAESKETAQELVVVTARWLADGAAVYLKEDGTWTRALQEAQAPAGRARGGGGGRARP